MSKRIDITNKTFDNVKVLEFAGNKNSHAMYICLCTRCNREFKATYINLVSGNTKSCQSCGNKISIELEKLIKDALAENRKISHIAKEYKVNRSAVYRIKKEMVEKKSDDANRNA